MSPYSSLPCPKQQDWRGLACRLPPPPDHGETGDVGAGRLAGRQARIPGGETGP